MEARHDGPRFQRDGARERGGRVHVIIGLGGLIVAPPNLIDRALGVRGFGKTIEEEVFRQIAPPLAHRKIGGGGKELVAVRVITERLDQEFEGGIQAKIGESRRHP